MSKEDGIKCEIDQINADRIGSKIKEQLRSLGYDEVVDALKETPCPVIKVEGVPRVGAIALVGYEPSQITDISFAKDGEGNVQINFKTPEDGKNNHHTLNIPVSQPMGSYIFNDGWGNLNIGLAQITDQKPASFEPIHASMSSSLRERQASHLKGFFECKNSIIVAVSPQTQKFLYEQRIGYPAKTFAIIQEAQAL